MTSKIWIGTGVLAALASASAVAGTGWDFDEEYSSREWRDISANWASDIHPNSPDPNWIKQNVIPPPREMWGLQNSGVEDNPQDCRIYDLLLDNWIRHWLDMEYRETINYPLPADYPPEFVSNCFP